MFKSGLPGQQGLYDPANEHDNCGIGFVADIKNRKSHDIVKNGLTILDNLTHRGAAGADPLTGDGSGILIQIPDRFYREECSALGFDLPEVGSYGVGMIYLPQGEKARTECECLIEQLVAEEGQTLLGWRDTPTDNSVLSEAVREIEPFVRQVFIGRGNNCKDTNAFERKLFIIRKQTHIRVRECNLAGEESFYIPTLSARTICFKGMMLSDRVSAYFTDLNDSRVESALALVHQRFSTNTFPSWELAQPFRYLCHNGEINTVRGNINWMAARRHNMSSTLLGDDLDKLWPLIGDGNSDSATFDNALELLVAGGYSLSHAMMLMIPEAWNDNPLMDQERRAFYEYNAALMEPWDGPAAVAFTDGRQIGATLDRNGLRPARYIRTSDDLVVMGSEVGALRIPDDKIVEKWRLQPGKMFLIDLEEGRIIDDEELKASLSRAHPYQSWLNATQIVLEDLPVEAEVKAPDEQTLLDRQQAFGYTQEDIKFFLLPMASSGQDPVGSMGRDIPHAVLSDRPKLLYDYFKQSFAQVTNPPIDPIREELVMSLVSLIGPRPNLLDIDSGGSHMRLEVRQPILTNEDLEKIRHIDSRGKTFKSITLDMSYSVSKGAVGMKPALEQLCADAQRAVLDGYNILIISDRAIDDGKVAIPALLATGAVHHHLIREGLRTESGLVVETGEARQVHDFCLLAGYGAEAINPYLAFDSITDVRDQLPDDVSIADAHTRYIKAIDKGMLKVMSKMGISTYQSYCGAQIFDAVGLSSQFIASYFTNTASAIEGVGLEEIAQETVNRHQAAFGDDPVLRDHLDVGGELSYRIRGEAHMWSPDTISKLQHSARLNSQEIYDQYAAEMNDQSRKLKNLRGLLDFKFDGNTVPLDEVEPASEIVKRFVSGAMSFGSISFEAHTNLAIAMNRIGGKSNTGEGGEQPERFEVLANGDTMRSAIKQVASGRFGVTTEYLRNSDEIQIKMAQGAKPGEGGQLPGHKVDETIARVRHSTPGVGLISPPPHHDIYSIEDLAQLIFDLKNGNPSADISVKLVSESGVGTIAAGVTKAHADHIAISGDVGGTGASPLTSIKNAGMPWELGLAEVHQTLIMNDLRSRVTLQTDGGLKTGRDVIIAALLGAEEFGFSTAPLISLGCIMMRKCHLNTCPVGIATQNKILRQKFNGQPEHVINYLFLVAEEARAIMARLGIKSIDDLVGRTDLLSTEKVKQHWKSSQLDLSPLLVSAEEIRSDVEIRKTIDQVHDIDSVIDHSLIKNCKDALNKKDRVEFNHEITNLNRATGAMLSHEIAKLWGEEGLPQDTIRVNFSGSAGQSFGAFLSKGVTFNLFGDTNDYVGKSLSGGKIIVQPPENTNFKSEDNILIGNVALYGATSGFGFFRGIAAERFGVRNSGAWSVVEGVGDHGCEYMTGGRILVLGETGVNFAAGMSGGIAYVFDPRDEFEPKCNTGMVELETLEDETSISEILRLLELHHEYTDSPLAETIMNDWDNSLKKFIKVMPIDYKRVMNERAEHNEEIESIFDVDDRKSQRKGV